MMAGEPGNEESRNALFISHAATPADNAFAIWLGSKLASVGYEVWADVLSLRGGDDWERKLEGALRHRARKMLLVANPTSLNRQGVRNEIKIASETAQRIGDPEFIIPLRLAPYEASFLIAHAQYIDFVEGWPHGLAGLLGTLRDKNFPAATIETGVGVWRDLQLIHARTVVRRPEPLLSNWLSIEGLPASLWFHDFKPGISIGLAQTRTREAPWPTVLFRRGFLSFAPASDLRDHFGAALPLDVPKEVSLNIFLDDGWEEMSIHRLEARNHFSNLARQAIEQRFRERRLKPYALSDFQNAWWPPLDAAPTSKISFQQGEFSGARQIRGVSAKRNVHWHYGVSVAVRSSPLRHVRLTGRLIFTSDGCAPLVSARRMHQLRRSFAKSWRNARWRDMQLAFLHWVAEGEQVLSVPVAVGDSFRLRLPPLAWNAPVSLTPENGVVEPDEDDPSEDDDGDLLEFDEHDDGDIGGGP